jgi:hypothetical protein
MSEQTDKPVIVQVTATQGVRQGVTQIVALDSDGRAWTCAIGEGMALHEAEWQALPELPESAAESDARAARNREQYRPVRRNPSAGPV